MVSRFTGDGVNSPYKHAARGEGTKRRKREVKSVKQVRSERYMHSGTFSCLAVEKVLLITLCKSL